MIKRLLFILVMAMTAVTSVVAAENVSGDGDNAVGIVAHRGYWNCEQGGYTRNSFAAFKSAADAGFWGTEFDVNMTADGQLLVFHDEVINGKRIDHTQYAELTGYRLENGEPIPTLDQFLEYASSRKTFPMLVFELKGHITDELQDRAVAASVAKLKEYGMFDPSKVMFISFYIRQCNLLAKAAPGFTVQYLGKDKTVDDLLDNVVNGIDVYYNYLFQTPDYLTAARKHGFSVNVWTVNDAENMGKVLDMGIDYLTTDHPDIARNILSEKNIPELHRQQGQKDVKAVRQKKLKKHLSAGDYVLCYAGGAQSKFYDMDWMKDLVTYTDREGKEHWLFDGFLFLQIMDHGAGVAFDPGHRAYDGSYLQSALQSDWLDLINYWFQDGQCLDAIDRCVADAAERLGDPGYKREIIISIPNPIPYKNPVVNTGGTRYWGLLDGEVADFSRPEDRLAACKWFIDEVLERYRQHRYRYIELKGFYFVTEETTGLGDLMPELSGYIHSKGYPFTWIPYYNAPGWNLWKEKGFDMAWYQPNYFFNDWLTDERLVSACNRALNYGMAMEMEFDERAAADSPDSRAGRLREYMAAYKKYGSWEKLPIAYYISHKGVHTLKYSKDPADVELYQDFCDFVAKRPLRARLAETNGSSRCGKAR